MDLSRGFNWGPGLFIIIYHVLLAAILPVYFYYCTPSWGIIAMTVALYFISGISITGGYHRLYSHRAYKANPIVEWLLVFFGTLAGQGSVIRWSFDHRRHHAYVDTDDDPYSIKKGFWYAHMLWLFEKPKEIDFKVVQDLKNKPLLMFQHTYYKSLFVFVNIAVFLFCGFVSGDYVSAFVFTWWVRLCALHHSTWFINSLAHTWGDKPFCQEHSAVNNYIISLLTFGEGYHNFHHTFATDYRNGIKWYHFDPTKWLIALLERCGLAYSLRVTDSMAISKRMVLERKSLLLTKLKDLWYVKKEDLEVAIQETSERILEHIAKLNQLKQKYYQIKKECKERDILNEISDELRLIQSRLKQDWKKWKALSKGILRLKPLQLLNT